MTQAVITELGFNVKVGAQIGEHQMGDQGRPGAAAH